MKIKYFFTHDRIAVLGLLALIFFIQFLYFFLDFCDNKGSLNINTVEIQKFQKDIDSLKLIELEKRKPKIYPFNPSFLTDYKAYKLGMKTEEIDKLLAHRKAGKYINSVEQFQKVTGVSDSLLAVISLYFKFPEWLVQKEKNKRKRNTNLTVNSKQFVESKQKMTAEKIDLNKATIEQFQKVNGVGVKLANRILKYRKVLQGYSFDEQLYEVWYLDKEVANRVMQHFTVKIKPEIKKVNINTASFKEVLHLPYIDYNLTKRMFNYRDEMAEIQSLEELKKIDSFPIEKYDRISLYLKAE